MRRCNWGPTPKTDARLKRAPWSERRQAARQAQAAHGGGQRALAATARLGRWPAMPQGLVRLANMRRGSKEGVIKHRVQMPNVRS
jgi:hypothetical protein